jgi:hypothetical protein
VGDAGVNGRGVEWQGREKEELAVRRTGRIK